MKRLTFSEEKALVAKALRGYTGKQRLIEYLQPQLEELAKKYKTGATIEDLVVAGLSNLDDALELYSISVLERKRYLFSVYYFWWARQGMIAFIAKRGEDQT